MFCDILQLQQLGVNIWYDGGMVPGRNWQEQAKTHLASFHCKGVIFYWSETSVQSNAMLREVEFAKKYGKPFFSINIPSPLMPGDDFSAEAMTLFLAQTTDISHETKQFMSENFNNDVLYCLHDDPICKKQDAIIKFKQPELINYKYATRGRDKAVVVSTNSFDVVKIKIPQYVQLDGQWCEVIEIAPAAFANNLLLEHIELPDSLEKISEYAFYGCRSLQTIKMNMVSEVGQYAFAECKALELETLNCTIGYGAFLNCTSIKRITITEIPRINSLKPEAFRGCKSLQEIHFPESLTEIGYDAFSGCEKLKRLDCPNNLIKIGDHAFYECYKLREITFNEGLKTIDNNAFAKCYELTGVTMPQSVTFVGEEAFCSCHNMEDVWFSASVQVVPKRCFMWCKTLDVVDLPMGVTTIEENAFTQCQSLYYLELPDSVVNVDEDAFFACPVNAYSNVIPESKGIPHVRYQGTASKVDHDII